MNHSTQGNIESHGKAHYPERKRMIEDWIRQHLLFAGGDFFEIGSNNGYWPITMDKALKGRGNFVGIDPNREAIKTAIKAAKAVQTPNVHFLAGYAEDYLEPHRGRFDSLFVLNVLQFVEEPVAALRRWQGFLKNGGHIVVKEMDFSSLVIRGPYKHFSRLSEKVIENRRQVEVRKLDPNGYENTWIGQFLPVYLEQAGYVVDSMKEYPIIRRGPQDEANRLYIRGIANWLVRVPYGLSEREVSEWKSLFSDGPNCILNRPGFYYKETEYVVTGIVH